MPATSGWVVATGGQINSAPVVRIERKRVVPNNRGRLEALPWVASAEVELHDGYKAKVVAAGAGDLVETRLFDGDWEDSPHRVIRNSTHRAWEAAGRPPPGERPNEGATVGRQPDGTVVPAYHVAAPAAGFEGDWEATALYAGTSALLVREIEPVEGIISRMLAEARASAQRSGAFWDEAAS